MEEAAQELDEEDLELQKRFSGEIYYKNAQNNKLESKEATRARVLFMEDFIKSIAGSWAESSLEKVEHNNDARGIYKEISAELEYNMVLNLGKHFMEIIALISKYPTGSSLVPWWNMVR